MATTSEANYTKGGISLKSLPKKGENVNLFLRPGDELNLAADLQKAELQLVGSDVIATLPGGGQITFVSLGMMAFENNAPVIKLPGGLKMDVGDMLNRVEDIATVPKDSVLVSGPVMTKDEKEASAKQAQKSQDAPVNDYNAYYVEPKPNIRPQDEIGANNNSNKYTEATASQVSFEAPKTITQKASSPSDTIYVKKNDFDAYKSDYANCMPKNDFTGYGNGDGNGNGDGVGPGQVTEAAKPVFYFKATAHQLTTGVAFDDGAGLKVLGGGGSAEGYTKDASSAQFEAETIDKTASTQDMTIYAENSAYFDATHLSRILRFAPTMPEGFYVESFVVGGLPVGVEILDKDGNAISGSTVTKDNMIFKDSNGNEISFTDADFLTKIKSAEFTVKYDTSTIPASFNISITANYALDSSYVGTTDINPNQSYTNSYTVVSKTIASASDYTYSKSMGNDEGFILATNVNSNTIKDGSGNDTVYGGYASDTIYGGAGDDMLYGASNNDTLYGGSGQNIVDGGTGTDKAGYLTAGAYTLDEMGVLLANGKITNTEYEKMMGTFDEDADGVLTDNSLSTQMLAYYKGVYVDLDSGGIDIDGDGTKDAIDINGDGVEDGKINVISKFVNKTGFVYDADGNATNASTANYALTVGYDVLTDIENVDGSALNDTIYGNDSANTINGLGGSDTLDGRGGSDTIYGGAGYDTLFSGTGNDTLDGGSDTDAANFQNSTAAVTVRLDKPNGDQFDDYADGYGHDTLISIEDIVGSNFGDTIVGNGSTNYLQGMDGNDIFLPGGGYDFMDGGNGTDLLTYYKPDYDNIANLGLAVKANNYETIQGITVDLNASDFTMVKETASGRLIDLVKGVEQIHATEGVDVIYGNNASGTAETFYTYGGNDRIESRNGADTIYAGDGNDYVRPGAGLDVTYGGNGVDFLELYDDGVVANQTLKLTETGTVQYWNGSAFVDGYNANGGINLAYEFESIGISNSNDTFNGNSLDNDIRGYGGTDTLHGEGGNDTIRGGDGTDTIYGDDGNDILYGDRNNDTIDGGNGDDIIYGSAYYAAAEQDKDVIDGGAGVDWLDYSGVSQAITANISTGIVDFATLTDYVNTYRDTFSNIENFRGGSGADTITGDANDNIIDGWSGVDNISAGVGNDTVIARAQSGETLDGGAGTDTLQLVQNVSFSTNNSNATPYITATNFEVLDIQSYTTYMNFTQFDQFNTLKGSGTLNLYGTNADNTLDFTNINLAAFTGRINAYGYNGNDIFDFTGTDLSTVTGLSIDAGGGTDTLKLGTNDVTLSTANFNTFENFDMSAGSTLTVNGSNAGENFNSGSTMNFTNVVDDDAVIINASSGNDSLRVNVDQISKVKFDGGAGTDTVYLIGSVGAGITKDLTADSYENNFSNIETINTGSATLTGNIVLSADALNAWDNSASSTTMNLDVTNTAQANKISVTEFDSATNTTPNPDVAYASGSSLAMNNYTIDANGGGVDLTLQVV